MEDVHVKYWTIELVKQKIKQIKNGDHLHRQFIENIIEFLRYRKNDDSSVILFFVKSVSTLVLLSTQRSFQFEKKL